MITALALMLGFISATGFAQDVSGLWLGVTYPSDPSQQLFNYTMTLTQTGGTLGGTAQTANPNVPFGGLASVSGQVTGTSVIFSEADQTGSTAVKDICFWKGKLTYNPVDESLRGTYENITNTTCTESEGGTVELYRIVLKSGSKFCKGSPINLRVTGQNIRWYTSAAKTNLLETGNTFSPRLSQTTTFYITQTLYTRESPPIPITIDIVEPVFTPTVTNAECGQKNGRITLTTPNPAGWQYSLNGSSYQSAPTFSNLGPGSYTVSVTDGAGCHADQSVTLTSTATPTIDSLTILPPRCGQATGQVTLTASGGTGALTYSLDGITYQSQPVFKELGSGSYTIRVRDTKGCEATRAATLPASVPVLIRSVYTTSARCNQPGSLSLTTTGGIAPLELSVDGKTFVPSTAPMSLRGGSYTILVRDGAGCTASQAINISGNSGPLIDSLLITAPKCLTANGVLTVLASGGQGALAYSLDESAYQANPQFGNLSGGRYTIRVRDATGCQVSKIGSLPLSNPLLIVGIAVKATTCGLANGQASLTVKGGDGPIRFSTDGRRAQAGSRFDSLQAGTYRLFAQDSSGCTAGQSVTVAASSLPTLAQVATTPEACGLKNATLTAFTGQRASKYLFSIDGTSFQPDSTFGGLSGGQYTLSVRDTNSCIITRTVSLSADCANIVHLPAAFSPNADNLNDALAPFFSFPSLDVVRFVVYDRWGGVLYSRTNFTLANGEPIWSGLLSTGEQAPAGSYAYRLDCRFPDGSQSTYRQSVAVLK
jgi:hypothetical protein